MKPTLPAIRSNKKTAKKLFLFFVMLSFAVRVFAQAPAITSFSPASGPVGTLVTIRGTNLSTPTAFSIGGVTALVINNTGTVLTGYVMPGAVTGAILLSTADGTVTTSAIFTVTPTLHSSMQQGSKLMGTSNTGAAQQGYSISLSADGNTAIVGGIEDNSFQGAAWIYTRNGSIWSQQGSKLIGTGSVGALEQGTWVSISADGNTAIVGGPEDNMQVGAAWVYTRSGDTWNQQGSKLVGTGSIGGSGQGTSVSISADGNTAIVGGPEDNGNSGAAWVFTRNGTTWSQQGGKLVGTASTATFLGYSVSISADGNTAIMGGFGDNSYQGAAWIYTRSGGTWSQQGSKLVGTGNTGAAQQGSAVSLSADGNTAIVGGGADNLRQGATWIFTRSGGTWSQQGGKLVGIDNTGPSAQGASVSLSADGNTAIVGGYFDNNNQGAAWIYTRNGKTWSQLGSKLIGTGNSGAAEQGFSVSLSAVGNIAMVGGSQDNSLQGATWVFVPSSNALLSVIKLTPASSLTNTGTSGNTTTYVTSVVNSIASVTVTSTAQNAGATIKVNGVAVTSGTASAAIALAEGANTTITIIVTAEDGVTTRTYSITVTRLPSPNASLSVIKLTPAATLTNTGTSGTTTTYTTAVAPATTSVTLTPTAADINATIKVNGVSIPSGVASGPIAVPIGQTTITTVVTAQDGTTTKTYSITVTRVAGSANATLSVIKLIPASTLTNAGTTGSTTKYTTPVSYATSSVTVTPTAQDATATIKVNGVAVTSGTASGSIALAVGSNTITIVVTAQNGTTTHTYSITVTRAAPSTNATLSAIKLTPASALTNTGTSGSTTTYTTTAAAGTTSVTVTPTAQDATATIKVNGAAVTSGTASGAIVIAVGKTTITIVATAQNGTTTHTYSIIVTRTASSNALLSTIKLTPASTLTNTGTSGTTTTYTTSVSNAETSVKVTPTAQDANAKIKVNGVAVTSGTASGSIALAVGQTTITTIVTAQDGTTTRTYSITVTRATGPLHSLYMQVSVTQPADEFTIENDGVLVHQGVSPNGDGINDFLIIDGIIAYPDNQLTIIDRSGSLIYQAKGYNNISKAFDGHSNINGRMQQPGTYFYSLDYVADGQNRHKTGFILLKY